MDRHQLEIRRLVRGLGLTLESSSQHGGHIKAVIRKGDTVKKVVFPVSPSDGRWKRNMESYLRKAFNGNDQ